MKSPRQLINIWRHDQIPRCLDYVNQLQSLHLNRIDERHYTALIRILPVRLGHWNQLHRGEYQRPDFPIIIPNRIDTNHHTPLPTGNTPLLQHVQLLQLDQQLLLLGHQCLAQCKIHIEELLPKLKRLAVITMGQMLDTTLNLVEVHHTIDILQIV